MQLFPEDCEVGNLIEEAKDLANQEAQREEENADTGQPNTDFSSADRNIFDPSENVRIRLSTLEKALDLIGEVVIAHAQVVHDPALSKIKDSNLEMKLTHLGKCTRSLQTLGMSMRVFPVQQVFAPLARTARDLALKLNKEVEVLRLGEDAELDKTILQALSDPLMHMIRNAADHGIDTHTLTGTRCASNQQMGHFG